MSDKDVSNPGCQLKISLFKTSKITIPSAWGWSQFFKRCSMMYSGFFVSICNLHPASPRLPNRLNMFLGLHPQWGNTGVPWISWALVRRGRGAHRAHVGQVRAVSQGRGVEEGGRQGRGHGRGRRRGVSAWEAVWARDEAREGLQGGGGGDRGGEPGVQLQAGAQGAGGRAAEGEQGGGGVLQLDGAHLQLLLPTPLSPPVLEPHLKRKRRILTFYSTQYNFIHPSKSKCMRQLDTLVDTE